jgi:simple sugar transport system ATP-binding protein
MTGREIVYETFEPDVKNGKRIIELRELTRKPHFSNVSLSVNEGEIVGITGPLGAGRTELALSLFGLNHPQSGEILFEDKRVYINNPARARELGITLLPEDRHSQGLFKTKSITVNLTAATLEQLKRFLIIDQIKAKEESKKVFNELRIKASSMIRLLNIVRRKPTRVCWENGATNPKLFNLDSPTMESTCSKSEI